VTWYRSSESSVSQAGLGVNLFAGWSKVSRVLVMRQFGARTIAEMQLASD